MYFFFNISTFILAWKTKRKHFKISRKLHELLECWNESPRFKNTFTRNTCNVVKVLCLKSPWIYWKSQLLGSLNYWPIILSIQIVIWDSTLIKTYFKNRLNDKIRESLQMASHITLLIPVSTKIAETFSDLLYQTFCVVKWLNVNVGFKKIHVLDSQNVLLYIFSIWNDINTRFCNGYRILIVILMI